MKTKRTAFTLIELMVVVAIIAVIASILLPVLARAKKSAMRTTSMSNLRQCAIALITYASDDGSPNGLPPMQTAKSLLAKMPTCDPSDNWRTSCSEAFGDPLIGSYAYIRGLRFFSDDDGFRRLQRATNPVLLVSIFYSNPEPPPFKGEYPVSSNCPNGFCRMPTGILAVRLDGSVAITKGYPRPDPGVELGFSWPNTFLLDSSTQWVKP